MVPESKRFTRRTVLAATGLTLGTAGCLGPASATLLSRDEFTLPSNQLVKNGLTRDSENDDVYVRLVKSRSVYRRTIDDEAWPSGIDSSPYRESRLGSEFLVVLMVKEGVQIRGPKTTYDELQYEAIVPPDLQDSSPPLHFRFERWRRDGGNVVRASATLREPPSLPRYTVSSPANSSDTSTRGDVP